MKHLSTLTDLQGGQLYNATVENTATWAGAAFPIGGAFKFMSANGDKRLSFWDDQLSAAIMVPRLDRAEIWTAAPAFNAQFTVGSTALITSLNADLLDSMDSATAATASTIAARSAGGIVRGADPVDPTDLVNLRYMQANLRNAVDKGAVRVSTIVSLPAYAFSGNEMVASANGIIPAQDGVTLAVNDLVAVLYEGGAGSQYYQGTAHNLNGIYKVTDIGTAGTPWKMIRAVNADVTSEVTPGMFFAVSEGTNQSNSTWTLFTDGPIVLRTDAPKGLAAVTAAGGTLTASTAYYYRITIVDFSGGEGATTLETTATTDVTNKTINLSWTLYSEAVSYRIYRSLVSGTYGATTLVGTTTSAVFSDTGIALTTGTPPTASALQFAKTGSNAFYSAGNGIDVSGSVISVKIEGSTTYVANRILFNGSTSTIDSDTNLQWNGTTLAVTGGETLSGVLNLSGTGQLHQLGGHNFMQGDATTTYFYGGTSGISIRSADNSAELISFSNAGIARFLATTVSTSTATGAVVVSGGVGIAGSVFVGVGVNVAGVLNLSGVNQIHQLSGHNFIQGDATTTYMYGGTSGISIRSADNTVELFSISNAGISRFLATTASTSISTGAVIVSGGVGIAGDVYLGSDLVVGVTGAALGTISVAGNTSGLVTIQPAAAAGTWTLTLPTTGGTADYFLKTNGSGVSSWSNSLPATTTIAGVSIPRVYVAAIGAGTDPTLTHSLNTRNIAVKIRRTGTPYDEVIVDNDATDANTVTFHFRVDPGAGIYTAIVMAI